MIRNATNDISIKPKMSSELRMATIAGAIIAILGALYFAYSAGVRAGHTQIDEDRLMLSQLNKTITSLRSELAIAQDSMITAQRQQQVQEEAYKQMSNAYAGSEQKNAYLGARLDFYRSIISPENGQTGPAIQAANTTHDGQSVKFDITLVQAIKHKHQVQGSLTVELYQGDKRLGQWPANSRRSVNYQYFQQVSGAIEAANLANSAKIKVQLSVQDGEIIERWFDVAFGASEPA